MRNSICRRPASCSFSPLIILSFCSLSLVFMLSNPIHGDEGMWLFNNPPRKLLKEKYDFDPSDEWLSHIQHSARAVQRRRQRFVRLGRWVGADQPSRRPLPRCKSSAPPTTTICEHGFHAKSRGEEIRKPSIPN